MFYDIRNIPMTDRYTDREEGIKLMERGYHWYYMNYEDDEGNGVDIAFILHEDKFDEFVCAGKYFVEKAGLDTKNLLIESC